MLGSSVCKVKLTPLFPQRLWTHMTRGGTAESFTDISGTAPGYELPQRSPIMRQYFLWLPYRISGCVLSRSFHTVRQRGYGPPAPGVWVAIFALRVTALWIS